MTSDEVVALIAAPIYAAKMGPKLPASVHGENDRANTLRREAVAEARLLIAAAKETK